VREVNQQPVLMFGADRIAELHAGNRVEPLLVHEIFHRYHHIYFSGCREMVCSLWNEGLASYVAHDLYPDATDRELLFDIPRPIRSAVETDMKGAVCSVRSRLKSESAEDYNQLFTMQESDGPYPPRYGYFVGYLAAKALAERYGLATIAQWDAEKVKASVPGVLDAIGNC
jgi:hypothetical protein